MDNLDNDPVATALLAHFKGDKDACARWIHTIHGTLTTKSLRLLLQHLGSYEATVTWLAQAQLQVSKPPSTNIERLHVKKRNPKTGQLTRTTVSLDPELWRTLVSHFPNSDEAMKWLQTTAAQIEPGKGSFSRELQSAIVQYVGQHRPKPA